MPRRGGDPCRARSAARRFPAGPELTGTSGVAAILHRFVVFHQQFTTFAGRTPVALGGSCNAGSGPLCAAAECNLLEQDAVPMELDGEACSVCLMRLPAAETHSLSTLSESV